MYYLSFLNLKTLRQTSAYSKLWALLATRTNAPPGSAASGSSNTFLRNWDTVHCCRGAEEEGKEEEEEEVPERQAVSTLQTGKRWEASRKSLSGGCRVIQCTMRACLGYVQGGMCSPVCVCSIHIDIHIRKYKFWNVEPRFKIDVKI